MIVLQESDRCGALLISPGAVLRIVFKQHRTIASFSSNVGCGRACIQTAEFGTRIYKGDFGTLHVRVARPQVAIICKNKISSIMERASHNVRNAGNNSRIQLATAVIWHAPHEVGQLSVGRSFRLPPFYCK